MVPPPFSADNVMRTTMSYTVSVIVLGGCRPDVLRAARTPVLDRLITQGAWTMEARTVAPSLTLPALTSLMHGVDVNKHGLRSEEPEAPVKNGHSLVDAMGRFRRRCGFFINGPAFRDAFQSPGVTEAYLRRDGANPASDGHIIAAAKRSMEEAPLELAMIYLGHMKAMGQMHGWGSAQQIAALEQADRLICDWMEDVDSYGLMHTTLVVSDHGGHERQHGTGLPEDMTIPWILHGLGVKPGPIQGPVRIFDCAPTIAKLLDLPNDRGWEGQAVAQALAA